jgi:YHS domain-containing protein
MTLNASTSATKDPICGMTVDQASAIHAERDGKTFYFCGDHCRQKFLSTPAGAKPEAKSKGCCG